jgi:ActR/RegA family two-component response regulator
MTTKPRFKNDVFVSYSHKNKKWVQGVLLPRLENAGLKVFIDFRDFKIGAANIREMERGVIQSRKTLVVLTPEYLESDWTHFEILMTQTLAPANRGLRVIPVLKKNCELPASVSYMNYVNFVNSRDKENQWKRLIDALGGNQKILVVDDMPDFRKTIGGLIDDVGVGKVYMASDENSAHKILKQENFDYAVIDIRLHESRDDESGLKLAKSIHASKKYVQIIILSGSTMPSHIISAFKDSGVIDYILKTAGWEDRLLNVIKKPSDKTKK